MPIKTPHDLIFQEYLSDIKIARDVVDIYVPEKIKSLCDLRTLKVEPTSFIEKNLSKHQADVLYSLKVRGEIGYIYILVEEQMQSDELMAFRVLRYQVSIMKYHLKKGHKKLPVVWPLLFYAGKRSPYRGTLDLFECFDNPALAQATMFKDLKLVDLTVIPDEEIKTHKSLALLELAQKHIYERDLRLAWLMADELSGNTVAQMDRDLVKSVLDYTLRANDAKDPEAFIKILRENSGEYREDVMTIAEYLKAEAVKQRDFEIARSMFLEGADESFIQRITKLPKEVLADIKKETKH